MKRAWNFICSHYLEITIYDYTQKPVLSLLSFEPKLLFSRSCTTRPEVGIYTAGFGKQFEGSLHYNMHFKPAILDLNSWTLLHPEMEGLTSSIEGWGMKKALIKYTYRGSYQHCLVGVSHQLNWTYKSSGPSTKVAAVIFLCAHSHHLQFFEGDEKIVELNDFSLYGKPKKNIEHTTLSQKTRSAPSPSHRSRYRIRHQVSG